MCGENLLLVLQEMGSKRDWYFTDVHDVLTRRHYVSVHWPQIFDGKNER